MENMRASLAKICHHQAPGRYVLSFMCASGNPGIYYLSGQEDLEKFPDRMLDYTKNLRYTGVFNYYNDNTYFKILNGLTCMSRRGHVAISNVAARSEELRLPELYPPHDRPPHHSVHFCHDPATDKYKVLAAVQKERLNMSLTSLTSFTSFSVFALGSDSSWRGVRDHRGLCLLGNSRSSSVCIKGILYCADFSTTGDYKDAVIAAFHVGRECFEAVAYPDGLPLQRGRWCRLTEVKGCLAVADLQDDDVGSWIIRLWIKVDAGLGPESWLEHRIQFPCSALMVNIDISIKACGLSVSTNRNGELVIGIAKMSSPRCWVFVHDMETENWTRIGMFLVKGRVIYKDFVVQEYVETPVLVSDIVDGK